jgi:carboxyl-terminal processing protease
MPAGPVCDFPCSMMRRNIVLLLASLLWLAGCGGGGGNPGTCFGSPEVCAPANPDGDPGTVPGESPDALANICTPDGEKRWVRAHLDDVYLWHDEIVDVPPDSYSTARDYFEALLVRSRDRFSFTAPVAEIDRYFQSGQEIGYGATFLSADGRIRVAYTEPDSPAAQSGIQRGAEIVAINGTPVEDMDRNARIAALYPEQSGITNQFSILDAGAETARDVELTSATITTSPVLQSSIINVAGNQRVGYLVFNDHVATAEDQLIEAFTQFRQSGISDLVLDLRYNSGGFLYIASEVGTMIGGSAVQGNLFEQLRFNDKHPERSNDPANRITFPGMSSTGTPLPQLNLSRVFVLTGSATCSASESIINGLLPFLQVITIGDTTCGKPYGSIQTNNCGQAYFAIAFEGLNAAGQGGYVDGIAPDCAASDDLERQLGDTNERLLAVALDYRATGTCPASALTRSIDGRYAPLPATEVHQPPWRTERIR